MTAGLRRPMLADSIPGANTMTEKPELTRRSFIETAGVATGAVVAAGTFAHPAIGKNVKGANDRLNFAILGPRRTCSCAHIGHLLAMKKEEKPVDIVAVCDVWDGNKEVGRGALSLGRAGAGLDPNDKAHVTKDYRKLLESKDIDAVVIGTPDHWHAKMSIDAMDAGKDVYCEKPMTHTIDEARQVAETVKRTRQIFTVGVQSTAHPQWRHGQRAGDPGQDRQDRPGPDPVLPQQRRRAVAVLQADRGHEPEDRRLEDVPRHGIRSGPRTALQPGPLCSVGAATGISAAVCTPTSSSTSSPT